VVCIVLLSTAAMYGASVSMCVDVVEMPVCGLCCEMSVCGLQVWRMRRC